MELIKDESLLYILLHRKAPDDNTTYLELDKETLLANVDVENTKVLNQIVEALQTYIADCFKESCENCEDRVTDEIENDLMNYENMIDEVDLDCLFCDKKFTVKCNDFNCVLWNHSSEGKQRLG